ncbi:MAG: MBL fold metallo-hydrolase [Betaproteobacteria bacterium]
MFKVLSTKVFFVTFIIITSCLQAQQLPPTPIIQEGTTVQVSPHVYVIPDSKYTPLIPNVGIIVGTKATLVIDPGLGLRNGVTVLNEVRKLSKNELIYMAPTHYHPEHTSGAMAFPAQTKFVYSVALEQDIAEFGQGMLSLFRKRSPETEFLLLNASYPKASKDLLFNKTQRIDLGGVHVTLTWLGPTHTKGDTSIFIEEDRVLFSGDIAMKGAFPGFFSPYASGINWIKSLNTIEGINAKIIIPSHGAMGDNAMIIDWRTYFQKLQARVGTLKAQGVSVDDVAKTTTQEFTAAYPNWAAAERIANASKAFYAGL